MPAKLYRMGLLAAVCLGAGLLSGSSAGAEERSRRTWSLGVSSGPGFPLDSFGVATRGVTELSAEHLLHEHLQLGGRFRFGAASMAQELVLSGVIAGRLRVGVLELVVGSRFGYAWMRAAPPELGEMWTGALVIGPLAEARLVLSNRWELRAAPANVTLFWNELWMCSWEPTAGLGVRF